MEGADDAPAAAKSWTYNDDVGGRTVAVPSSICTNTLHRRASGSSDAENSSEGVSARAQGGHGWRPATRACVQPVKQRRHSSSGEKVKPCTREEEEADIQGFVTAYLNYMKSEAMASFFFGSMPP